MTSAAPLSNGDILAAQVGIVRCTICNNLSTHTCHQCGGHPQYVLSHVLTVVSHKRAYFHANLPDVNSAGLAKGKLTWTPRMRTHVECGACKGQGFVGDPRQNTAALYNNIATTHRT
jgi:hypothetical protein